MSKKPLDQQLDLLIQKAGDQKLFDASELKALRKLQKKAAEPKKKKPERGIETWFRLTSRNLYTRRQIVDTKSNILISTNAIIISVVLGTLYIRLTEDPHLIYPIILLLITNVVSITYAIFATRPRLADGLAATKDIPQADLMTFDDFYKLSQEDYHDKVNSVLDDASLLYPTIIRDIYKLGVDLSRRYKYIRNAYDVFLYGIILSLLAFGMCHLAF